jgi:hypothetical protein
VRVERDYLTVIGHRFEPHRLRRLRIRPDRNTIAAEMQLRRHEGNRCDV